MWRNIFTGKERRRFIRLVTTRKVDFKINGENNNNTPWHSGETGNICLEGLCLITDIFSREKWEEVRQKKSYLYLQIYLPGNKEGVKAEAVLEKIDVKAEVVWHRREHKEGKEIYFLGLNFIHIENDSQEAIRQYIVNNLIKSYHPT